MYRILVIDVWLGGGGVVGGGGLNVRWAKPNVYVTAKQNCLGHLENCSKTPSL